MGENYEVNQSFNLADLFNADTGRFAPGQDSVISDLLASAGLGSFRQAELDPNSEKWNPQYNPLSGEDMAFNADLLNQLGGDSATFGGRNVLNNGQMAYENTLSNNGNVLSSQVTDYKKPSFFNDMLFPSVIKGFLGSMFGQGALGALGGSSVGGAGATNAALAESAAGLPGYGVSSASPGLLAGAPAFLKSGVRGAVSGGLNSGMSGGNFLEGALKGGAGAATSTGLSGFNPAEKIGITNPDLQSLFNRGAGAATNAAVRGGNPVTALTSSLLTGGLNYAGRQLFPQTSEGTSNMSMDPNGRISLGQFLDNPQTFAPTSFSRTEPWQQDLFGSSLDFGNQMSFDPSMFTGPDTTTSTQNPIMQFLASQFGSGAKTSPNNISRGGAGLGDIAGSLLGLYQANRQRRAMKQQAGALSAMFNQNSPSTTALRNQLNRRDAAAGRRSQYGPREVELQARLAQMASNNAPAQMAAQNSADQAQMMMFRNLLQLGNQTGAFKGLAGLFGG